MAPGRGRAGAGTPRGRGGARARARAGALALALAGALAGARAQDLGANASVAGNATATESATAEASEAPAFVWDPPKYPVDVDYGKSGNPNGPPTDWTWLNSPRAKRTGELSTEAALKRFLGIGNETAYDVTSYPYDQMWAAKGQSGGNRTGLDVGVSIDFHRVYEIDERSSKADLSVWLSELWYDPRLVWDPEDWNGIDTLYVWVGDGGKGSEIWVPSIELWNAVTPMTKTFATTYARVKSNGQVKWSRPGRMEIMCNFKGLQEYPFDELACRIELGSWLQAGDYIQTLPMDGIGWSVGGSSTAGQRFEQFKLSSVNCTYYDYNEVKNPNKVLSGDVLLPGSSREGGVGTHPVLWYDVTFVRAWRPHLLTFVSIQIILNILSFSVFWLPGGLASRIAMGITAMLTGVTNQLVMERQLPPAQAWTWASRFAIVCLCFTGLSLIETVCVHYFFYLRESDVTPLLFSLFGIHLSCTKVPDRFEHPPELLEKALSSPSRHAWGSSSWKDPNSGEAHRKDADDFLNRLEEENNRYWQKVARWIDEFARWVIPPVYIVVLAVMLGTADYREPKGLISGPTYEGYKSDPLINITAPGANS